MPFSIRLETQALTGFLSFRPGSKTHLKLSVPSGSTHVSGLASGAHRLGRSEQIPCCNWIVWPMAWLLAAAWGLGARPNLRHPWPGRWPSLAFVAALGMLASKRAPPHQPWYQRWPGQAETFSLFWLTAIPGKNASPRGHWPPVNTRLQPSSAQLSGNCCMG